MEENEEKKPLSKAFYLLREEAKEDDLRAINQAINDLATGVNLMPKLYFPVCVRLVLYSLIHASRSSCICWRVE
ncbi:hypothetical protein [Taibaiella koreensis]|uniref:hypothetical protein n=1 Tax=Taibaiella koreensis TaxID=1268548 RepID=UPI0013C33A16|nr:hypothetical protein [Taibaiella koreensis]